MGASSGNGNKAVWDFVCGLFQWNSSTNSGIDSDPPLGAGIEQPRLQDGGLGSGAGGGDPGLLLRNTSAIESREVIAVKVAAALCRRFEGLYLHPYLCPAGVPTIGVGCTYYEDGRAVKLTDPAITKERAEALLLWMVETVYLPAVLKLCPNLRDSDKLAAIIDFAFNLGTGRLKASTLRKRVNAEDWEGAAVEVMKWIKGGGRVLRGLVLRREAEKALLLKG